MWSWSKESERPPGPWALMFTKLWVAVPTAIMDYLDKQDKHGSIITRIIPFVIVLFSVASVRNLANRAALHHSDLLSNIGGGAIATLVPLAVFSAMILRPGNGKNTAWVVASVVSVVSGVIQYQIYHQPDNWVAIAEGIAFGFGVPVSEILLALLEGKLVKQSEDDKLAEEREAEARALTAKSDEEAQLRAAEAKAIQDEKERGERENAARIDKAEADARVAAIARQSLIDDQVAAQKVLDDAAAAEQKRENDRLAAEQKRELERQKVEATLAIKLQRAGTRVGKAGTGTVPAVPGTIGTGGTATINAINHASTDAKRVKMIEVLDLYKAHPNMPMKDAGVALGMAKSSVSRHLDALAKLEVVDKKFDPVSQTLTVTANGKEQAFRDGLI